MASLRPMTNGRDLGHNPRIGVPSSSMLTVDVVLLSEILDRARNDGAFPLRYYWETENQPGSSASPLSPPSDDHHALARAARSQTCLASPCNERGTIADDNVSPRRPVTTIVRGEWKVIVVLADGALIDRIPANR